MTDTTPAVRKPLYGPNNYLRDPEGLARMRETLIATPDWHDPAPINCNSLARLLDTIDELRALAALSPSREGVEPEAGAVGAAEKQVGKAVYERIEALVSRNPTPDSSDWAELDYLSHLAESVEEVGEFDGPLAPLYTHPTPAGVGAWDRAVNLGHPTDEPTPRQMVEHYYRSHGVERWKDWSDLFISLHSKAHPTPADDRLAVAVEALEPFAAFGRFEAEVAAQAPDARPAPDDSVFKHWDDAFDMKGPKLVYGDLRRAAEVLALLTQSVEAEG